MAFSDWENRDTDDPTWWAFHAQEQEREWAFYRGSQGEGVAESVPEHLSLDSWDVEQQPNLASHAVEVASEPANAAQQLGELAWTQDAHGDGEEEWGAPHTSNAPWSERSLCSDYLMYGSCHDGVACKLVHGRSCQVWFSYGIGHENALQNHCLAASVQLMFRGPLDEFFCANM